MAGIVGLCGGCVAELRMVVYALERTGSSIAATRCIRISLGLRRFVTQLCCRRNAVSESEMDETANVYIVIGSVAIGVIFAWFTRDYANPPAKSLLLRLFGERIGFLQDL